MPAGSRLVTGNIKDLTGAATPGAVLSFARAELLAQDGDAVTPTPVSITTDNAGAFSIALYPGFYYGEVTGLEYGPVRFEYALTEDGSTDFQDGISQAAPLLSNAAEVARDQAVAAAAAAQLDRVQTGLDAEATAADRIQTGLDRAATEADRIQTGADRIATAADRVQTGLDRGVTTADRAVTTADRVVTTADRNQSTLNAAAALSDRILAQTAAQEAELARDAAIAAKVEVQALEIANIRNEIIAAFLNPTAILNGRGLWFLGGTWDDTVPLHDWEENGSWDDAVPLA